MAPQPEVSQVGRNGKLAHKQVYEEQGSYKGRGTNSAVPADLPTVWDPQRPLRSAESAKSAHRRGFEGQGVLGPQPEAF